MLRFTSKQISLLSTWNQSIVKGKSPLSYTSLYRMGKLKSPEEFNNKFKSGLYFEVLGYSPDTTYLRLNDEELKRRYLSLIKKYHSDGFLDPI